MSNGQPFFEPLVHLNDGAGTGYAGAKGYFYQANTVIEEPVYTDAGLTTQHTQPVTADANGRFPAVYVDPTKIYDIHLKDSADVDIPGYPHQDYQIAVDLDKATLLATIQPIVQLELDAGLVAGDIDTNYSLHDYKRYKVVDDATETGGVWTGTDNTQFFTNANKVAQQARGGAIGTAGKQAQQSKYLGGGYRMWLEYGNYYAPGQMDFREVQCDIDGCIRTGVATAAYNVLMGGDAVRPTIPQRIWGVRADGNLSDSLASNVDIQVEGSQGQTITVESVGTIRFYTKGKLDSDAYGTEEYTKRTTSYSIYNLGVVWNIIVDSDNPETTQRDPVDSIQGYIAGWTNVNRWVCKQFHRFEVNGSDRYKGNQNIVEGGATDDAVLKFNFARSWRFIDQRLESLDEVDFGGNSEDITIEGMYSFNNDAFPGTNFLDTVIKNTAGAVRCRVINKDLYDMQYYGAYAITAETLHLDDDASPNVYPIKGVGGQSTDDHLVAPGSGESGTITKVSGRLRGFQNDCLILSDYIPVSPKGLSTIAVSLRGAASSSDGLRVQMFAYDRDKNIYRVPGGEQKEISDLNVYQWTLSTGGGTNEYYLEKVGGGDAKIIHPTLGADHLYMDDGTVDSYIDKGTVGSLADHEWGEGDVDGLGYNTIYIADASGAPSSAANRQFWLDRAVTNIESITQEFAPLITTTIKHGLSNGQKISLGGITPNGGDPDPGNGNNMMDRILIATVESDTTLRVNRDNRNYNAITAGFVMPVEMSVKPGANNFGSFGRQSFMSGDDQHIYARILAPDIHYVRVRAQAGDAPAIDFDQLTIGVLAPKADYIRYQTDVNKDGEMAVNQIPVLNPPIGPAVVTGTVTPPGFTPAFVGQRYIKTNATQEVWEAYGTSAATDWVQTG